MHFIRVNGPIQKFGDAFAVRNDYNFIQLLSVKNSGN